MAYTDSTGYQALITLLEAIPGIELSWFGAGWPRDLTAESYPVLWICPLGWEQEDTTDPPEPVRTVNFEVRLIARGQGGFETFQILDELGELVVCAIAAALLDGASDTACDKATVTAGQGAHEEVLTLVCNFLYLRDDPSQEH